MHGVVDTYVLQILKVLRGYEFPLKIWCGCGVQVAGLTSWCESPTAIRCCRRCSGIAQSVAAAPSHIPENPSFSFHPDSPSCRCCPLPFKTQIDPSKQQPPKSFQNTDCSLPKQQPLISLKHGLISLLFPVLLPLFLWQPTPSMAA